MTERPIYVEPLPNGSYGICEADAAHGIAYEGQVYHLEGRPEMEGLETVLLIETDVGALLAANQECAADNDAINVDHEFRLTLLELGITEEV